jgi:pimeloyl-ACP methyl ester carboxylesterase
MSRRAHGERTEIETRSHGSHGPQVIVLHGGPGAPGSAAPLARGLADSFHVLEPLQRSSGGEPLTVARHIADLKELVDSRCHGLRPALVGHSWGAMLALAYAAGHPGHAGPMVLIGCGTFDPAARERLRAAREARTDDETRQRLENLPAEHPDTDQRLQALGELIRELDAYELITEGREPERCDARAHLETWEDMLRLQAAGVYPAAFAAIGVPVLMLHGAQDPHPGRVIHAGLKAFMPHIEYRELNRCGHYPWLEKWARERFFHVLHRWLAEKIAGPMAPGNL